jgi:polar amino acid transport system substrate-binding protein
MRIVYIILLLLCACSNEKVEYEAFKVATSADNPPYSFIENDKIVGFEIDLINKIAQEMGAPIVIVNIPFSGIIQSLVNGDVDLLIAGMSQTPERSKMADFSEPYFYSTMSLITSGDFKITTLDDLKGKVIGAQIGSTWQEAAQNLVAKTPGLQLRVLANNFLLIEELKVGNIDAIVMESPQVSQFIARDNSLHKFDLLDNKSALAIVLKKDSSLKKEVNNIILKLQKEGYIEFLADKWLEL